jgi:exonuclease V
MKQGSAVHQALEDEIHTTVPVEITKKEDGWGLRIWNIIQGLRTLRETGKTRELEIWGSVGGELVNGVIDELSCECPDPKLEEMSRELQTTKDIEPPLPEYQASIRDYLVTSENRDQRQSQQQALKNDDGTDEFSQPAPDSRTRTPGEQDKRIYITDVKTRQTPTLPTGSAIRPTLVQLHLYHHMLENLAQGKFPLSHLAERYGFDTNETFSDSFIAQIGGLDHDLFALSQQSDDMRHDNLPSSTQDSMDILLQHNTLAALWGFMLEQLRLTFILPSESSSSSHPDTTSTETNTTTAGHDLPDPTIPPPSSLSQLPIPPSQPTRLSPILTARYIATNYNHSDDTRILGSKSLLFNPSFLTSQLYASLGFWKGERQPRGVEVNDAWKCRICEFRDECAWVKERDEVMVREVRERRKLKAKMEGGEDGEADKGKRSRV